MPDVKISMWHGKNKSGARGGGGGEPERPRLQMSPPTYPSLSRVRQIFHRPSRTCSIQQILPFSWIYSDWLVSYIIDVKWKGLKDFIDRRSACVCRKRVFAWKCRCVCVCVRLRKLSTNVRGLPMDESITCKNEGVTTRQALELTNLYLRRTKNVSDTLNYWSLSQRTRQGC